MSKDMAYYMENQSEFDALTDEQILELSSNGVLDGDTATAENKDSPDLVQENEDNAGKVVEPEAVEPELLAKDGKHTIPYQELLDAREKAAQWESFASEQAAMIESLKAAKVEDAKTGGTEAQEAVLAEYSGEFPDVVKDMQPYIQSMIDAGVKAKMTAALAEFEAKVNSTIAPMQQAAQETAVELHFATIKEAIPDFDALVDSGAVQDWIKTQPKFVQAPANAVLEKGTAAEVIELFSAYKKANETPQSSALSKEEIKAKADAKIAVAKGKPVTSLTDIPSGTPVATDELTAMEAMSASQLLSKFETMGDPAKIIKILGRLA